MQIFALRYVIKMIFLRFFLAYIVKKQPVWTAVCSGTQD